MWSWAGHSSLIVTTEKINTFLWWMNMIACSVQPWGVWANAHLQETDNRPDCFSSPTVKPFSSPALTLCSCGRCNGGWSQIPFPSCCERKLLTMHREPSPENRPQRTGAVLPGKISTVPEAHSQCLTYMGIEKADLLALKGTTVLCGMRSRTFLPWIRPRRGLTQDYTLARLHPLPYPMLGSASKEPNLIQLVSPQSVMRYNPLLEKRF